MEALSRRVKTSVAVSGGLLVVLWLVEVANLLMGGGLDRYGIRPRDLSDVAGILWAPFIHVSVAHLLANSAPFLVLATIVLLRSVRTFVLVSLIVLLVGGLLTWLIGRPYTVEVGASGVIFGYLGYLLARGFVERSLSAVLISAVVLVLYGGVLWGLLPGQPGVSFEGHISGFLSGLLAAWLLGKVARRKRQAPLATRPSLARR